MAVRLKLRISAVRILSLLFNIQVCPSAVNKFIKRLCNLVVYCCVRESLVVVTIMSQRNQCITLYPTYLRSNYPPIHNFLSRVLFFFI
jgi:hypothetical protein